MTSTARPLAPRPLTLDETSSQISHWLTHLEIFFSRDKQFQLFVRRRWNRAEADWGFADEPDPNHQNRTLRTAAAARADCELFLATVVTYMPNDDLEERIRAASSFNGVKEIIRDY